MTSEMYRTLLVLSFCAMYSDDRGAKMLFSILSEPRHMLIELDSARHMITTTALLLTREPQYSLSLRQWSLFLYSRNLRLGHY